ncbi:MAG: helix-turn-helix transcriptional regulator [Clostridia bacterium]|nr:helix-turn-helix transcriptional regulator [Clostridia bacterium]
MKNAIVNYLRFLQSEQGLSLSLHLHTPFMTDELLPYNVHCGKYCLFLKGNRELWSHCMHRQKKIFEKCKEATPFFGMCFAGVWEYIYPITYKNDVFGFVSVSGYRVSCEKTEGAIDALCATYHLKQSAVKTIHTEALADTLPSQARLDTLMMPLCAMLREYCREVSLAKADPSLYGQVLHYLRFHHTEDISVARMAKDLYSSPSAISHLFKQKSGKSIREYVNELRLSDTKHLLLAGKMSMQSIAMAVGYRDAAYLSKLFKEKYGISPSEYRTNAIK